MCKVVPDDTSGQAAETIFLTENAAYFLSIELGATLAFRRMLLKGIPP